ncbi:hypothetical protein ACLOJK_006520 [Asimina triloba]
MARQLPSPPHHQQDMIFTNDPNGIDPSLDQHRHGSDQFLLKLHRAVHSAEVICKHDPPRFNGPSKHQSAAPLFLYPNADDEAVDEAMASGIHPAATVSFPASIPSSLRRQMSPASAVDRVQGRRSRSASEQNSVAQRTGTPRE